MAQDPDSKSRKRLPDSAFDADESTGAGRPPDPALDVPMDLDDDESTALITLEGLNRFRREPKDRHLLVRVRGSGLGQVTRLANQTAIVGRNPDATLYVPDEGVSRRHAMLMPEADGFVIVDTESANGTFVGGQRITRQLLRDGDLVQFGPSAAFRYTLTDENQESLLRQLFEASVTDALTGAYNREHLDAHLRAELSFARRHKTDVSLVLFDVDHFKKVNDGYGHQAGDQVLTEIARAVAKMVRNEDLFARYGGEEFAVVLRGVGPVGAMSLGERLRLAVQALSITTEKAQLRVTVSVGCASVTELSEATPEALIGCADRRLYAAKRGGRNRVVATD